MSLTGITLIEAMAGDYSEGEIQKILFILKQNYQIDLDQDYAQTKNQVEPVLFSIFGINALRICSKIDAGFSVMDDPPCPSPNAETAHAGILSAVKLQGPALLGMAVKNSQKATAGIARPIRTLHRHYKLALPKSKFAL